MEVHLSREPERERGNHRNGHNRKRVSTESGSMDLAVPRDRLGRFEPQLVERYARRLPGFNDKVISMYARGMTTREIAAHVEEMYGLSMSRELISKVTDSVHEEVQEWQSRPLEPVYAIVYFDAIQVKIRDGSSCGRGSPKGRGAGSEQGGISGDRPGFSRRTGFSRQ